MTQKKTLLLLWSALSLTLTTIAYAQPATPHAAATSTQPALELLKRGQEARQAQEYERAYELHLRALWAMQAQRAASKQDTPSAQETALTQALPTLREQALISSGVLGWASVRSDHLQSYYQEEVKVELFGAYASIGSEQRMEHLLPSLADKRDSSSVSHKVKVAQRYMDERPTITRSKVLRWLCWGAPGACPLTLKRQAQRATASLWPPLRYINWYAYHGAVDPKTIAARLKELSDQGAPHDLALSALLYCQDAQSACMDVLASGALKSKDPTILAQARLINLVWFFTTLKLEDRFSLMWTYHKLMKDSGEVEQASQWLAQVGVPLLLKSSRKLPDWQLTRMAGQLFDYGLNAQAHKLLAHLQQHYKKHGIKDKLLYTYIKHGQLEAALRLYDELHPLGSYVKRADTFLELLVSQGAGDKLPYYIAQLKPHQERYRAYAMFALRVATDPDKPDLKLARTLLNRAQVELAPIIRDSDYLEGKVYHLKVLGVFKAHKNALNLVVKHLRAFKAKPTTDHDEQLIALAGAAAEGGHEAAFRYAFKSKLRLVKAQKGPIYDISGLFLGTHKLFESLVKAGRAKEFFELIEAGADQHYKKKLSSLGIYALNSHVQKGSALDLKFFVMLRKRILAAKAKGDDISAERNTFYALCVNTKRPELAIELSQTLAKMAKIKQSATDLVDTEALWLVRTGAIDGALKRYNQLSDEYRFRILSHIATELVNAQEPSERTLDDLIARADALPDALKARLNHQLVAALTKTRRCEQATKLLLLATPADEQLEQVATACLYAHKPAQALQLIEQIRLDTNKARALIQVGYYLDLSGQSRLPEVQAILKRAAKALEAP